MENKKEIEEANAVACLDRIRKILGLSFTATSARIVEECATRRVKELEAERDRLVARLDTAWETWGDAREALGLLADASIADVMAEIVRLRALVETHADCARCAVFDRRQSTPEATDEVPPGYWDRLHRRMTESLVHETTRALLAAVADEHFYPPDEHTCEEEALATYHYEEAFRTWHAAGRPNLTPAASTPEASVPTPEECRELVRAGDPTRTRHCRPAPEALGEVVQRVLPATDEGNAIVDELLAKGRSAECRPLAREATDDDYERAVAEWRAEHSPTRGDTHVPYYVMNAIDSRVRLERGRGR